MLDNLLSCHYRIYHKFRLKWTILDHDSSVIHHPLAVLGVVNLRHLELVSQLPVGACVVNRDSSAAFGANLLYEGHEETILREVDAFRRQKFGRLEASYGCLLHKGPSSGTQLHFAKDKDSARVGGPGRCGEKVFLDRGGPPLEVGFNDILCE